MFTILKTLLKYLSPVGSMIKLWNTTFWFLWNIKHHNHATFMNQKVVFQNFIIEPTGDKYFSTSKTREAEELKGKFNKFKLYLIILGNFFLAGSNKAT